MERTPPIDAKAFNAFEAEGWERRVDAYDGFFTPITGRLFGPLLDAVGVVPGTRLLDVATGPGHLPARAAERGAVPVGVDVADAMVTRARELYPTLEFHRGDAEELPFADAEFDAVTANFLLPHLARPERAMAELVRVLAPGGRLALATWDVPSRARLFGFFLEAFSEVGAAPPSDLPAGPDVFRFADDAAFTDLLATAGLRDVEVSPIDFNYEAATFDEYWQALQEGTVRMSSLLHGQSKETRLRIRDALKQKLNEHRAPTDTITLPVAVKLAAGRKLS
ncbi:MAG TPA: class I SAM-dependent methyltransferase [Acidimicrobiia bacterium]|jgi:ubiquinone/menaquinone biosynthesis C-methylase UbiE|nr:class I SAM-dependent methyltransferase [Acidimicrobiia bacterium]